MVWDVTGRQGTVLITALSVLINNSNTTKPVLEIKLSEENNTSCWAVIPTNALEYFRQGICIILTSGTLCFFGVRMTTTHLFLLPSMHDSPILRERQQLSTGNRKTATQICAK
jgi:hypothetical protein